MEAKDKYKMFKNFMFNELNISKEDIHEWVHEAVNEEAKRLVNQEYSKFSISDIISTQVFKNRDIFDSENSYRLREDIKAKIAEYFIKRIDITIE